MSAAHRLTTDETRRFYDRLGRRQDFESAYQDRAFDRLVALGDFEHAGAVLEFGCGTGRLAQRLLASALPLEAHYVGLDVSGEMVSLSRERLAPWSERAEVKHTDGALRLPFEGGRFDRFVATYALDLLSPEDIATVLDEAARVLVPGGALCLAALTPGDRGIPRLITRAWRAISDRWPARVGGCRPLDLRSHLAAGPWVVVTEEHVTALSVPSQIIIARAAE